MADADGQHFLLLYAYVDGMAERRAPFRESHLERIRAEQAAGRVIMAGALGVAPTGGAMVFRGVEAQYVERFVAEDPYVEAGLVLSYRVEPWKLV